jgi:predicted lipid-binding transport protein (Tim44 family)
MRDVFDIYTIIFLALAVFIFLRLRSVLGQRTGRERPPFDAYSPRDAVRGSTGDKVVALPPRGAEAAPRPAEVSEPAERWKGIAEPGSSIASGLDAIVAADPSFDAKHFLTGARAAYEMIVTAFAEGDRRTLRNMLSRDVAEGFEAAISERRAARRRRRALCRSTRRTSPPPSCAAARRRSRCVSSPSSCPSRATVPAR